MKRFILAILLGLFLASEASAATWVYSRRTSFPKFGQAQILYNVSGSVPYRYSKTLRENKDEVPYRYQVGFRQKDAYLPRPKRIYQIEVP